MLLPEIAVAAAAALLLGLHHGLDTDHIAVVDGMVRRNGGDATGPFARSSGVCFALGHGLTIASASMMLALLDIRTILPDWLWQSGQWIALLVLLGLGTSNISSALRQSAHVHFASSWMARCAAPGATSAGRRKSPFWTLGVGAAFALSFDALGIAVLFSGAAGRFDTLLAVFLLAVAFTLGMLIVDALAAALSASLLSHGLRRAPRVVGTLRMVLGLGCLIAAGIILLKEFYPGTAEWLDDHRLYFTAGIWLLVPGAYVASTYFSIRAKHGYIYKEEYE